MKYVITVRMAKTPCRKGSENEVCGIHQDPEMARVITLFRGYNLSFWKEKSPFDLAIGSYY